MSVNVLITGYGKVGKDMTGYLINSRIVKVAGIVEPSKENGSEALKTSLPVYNNVNDAIYYSCPDVVIDCSTAGKASKI